MRICLSLPSLALAPMLFACAAPSPPPTSPAPVSSAHDASPATQPVGLHDTGPRTEIPLTACARITPGPGWKVLPQTMRGLVEIVLEEGGKVAAHASATFEARPDHADAVRRLSEIAEERAGEQVSTKICGWPALERKVRTPLAGVQSGEGPMADLVTVAIAVGDHIVRFEGDAPPGSTVANDILKLGRSTSCSCQP